MRVIIGDPDPKHIAYVKQILGILNHTLVGGGADATWLITAARQAHPDIAIIYGHFEDISLGRTVQSLFEKGVKSLIIGAKVPVNDIERYQAMPNVAVVMRPFTVQKMAEAISHSTNTPMPAAKGVVAKPAAPATAPAAAPVKYERPSFVT
ncbi:MAG: hypothetical protein WCE44_00540 [Candidatus Velthaea sp.]|jgi:DNA-binding NarL/FixJ family response regulator